jgi:hypothetical protein
MKMKMLRILCVMMLCLVVPLSVNARDTVQTLLISEIMETPEYAARLQGVKFFFGDQAHPTPIKNFGEFRTNKKTNAFNKTDKYACQWAMLSALLQLQERAIELGGSAVINIKSNYRNVPVSSETEFTCGAGNVVAGVALIGEIISTK